MASRRPGVRIPSAPLQLDAEQLQHHVDNDHRKPDRDPDVGPVRRPLSGLALRAFDPPVRVTDQALGLCEKPNPGGHVYKITTLRRISPRFIFAKAASTPSIGIVSETKRSRGRRFCRKSSISIGKSRDGRQSPYQLGLSAPPRPKNSIIGSSTVIAGSGTPTCTSVPARSRA